MDRQKRLQIPPPELESQFILRLPPEPAKVLKKSLKHDHLLKDKLFIKIDDDMRYGEVRFDQWVLHAKVVDLPTIVESLKTMDHKSFYKTADIFQMVICKEEDDRITDEKVQEEQPKQKDSNKVDRQFWWPHGLTPPLKNVRKRRFRKVLKKKIVETLETEKEIKRLLQVDNDAVNVKWEVIYEEEEDIKSSKCSNSEIVNEKTETNSSFQSVDLMSRNIVEHDIFGGTISDSEDENEKFNINKIELEEISQLSIDSQLFDFNSNQGNDSKQSQQSTDTLGEVLTDNSYIFPN